MELTSLSTNRQFIGKPITHFGWMFALFEGGSFLTAYPQVHLRVVSDIDEGIARPLRVGFMVLRHFPPFGIQL